MRDLKCCMKFAPTAQRKEEAERLNRNDAPIATRLRSLDKDVHTSLSEPKGVTGANNHTEKQSQPSRHQHDKSNHSEVTKSEVHTSSSPWKTGQPSTDEDAKKINDSTLPPSRSRQLSKGPDNSRESKSPSRNEHIKKQLAQKRAAQAKSETSNASSSSQVWEDKEKSTRPSEEPARQPMEESSRPSEDQEPAEQSIVEDSIHYIRREGFGKATERIGYICELCEKDLVVSPFKEEEEPPLPPEDELYWDYFFQQEEEQLENSFLLPEVSVFPCGHFFHSLCLQLAQFEEQVTDPTCPFCLSLF